jgi:argininosuccinate lyase
MPQKNNPDVLELIRARTARVLGQGSMVLDMIKASPSGYNRDLQEVKEPFFDGLAVTRASVRILAPILQGMKINRKALEAGFTPEVFATDRALELVAEGMPFRDAYQHVKDHLAELEHEDPYRAIARKQHVGATAGLDFPAVKGRIDEARGFVREERKAYHRAVSSLLGVRYPDGLG